MRKIRRLLKLSWRERVLLARAVVYLVMARARWSGGFRSGRMPADPQAGSLRSNLRGEGTRAELFAWAVYTASRNVPFSTTCLDRALALFRLLHAAGLDAALRVGVRTAEGALEAHAWVEHQGVVLLDEEASRFVAFDAPILTTK